MFAAVALNTIICAIVGLVLTVLRTKQNSAVSCARV